MRTIANSWKTIEEVLEENANSVFRALRKPATKGAIAQLETRIGAAKLPRDLMASLRIHDGLRNSFLGSVRLFNYWALLPSATIASVWKSMVDLQAECNFGGDHVTTTKAIKNDSHWRAGWVPFLDADGDKFIIDLDPGPEGQKGQVICWSNSGSYPMRVLAPSFQAWLSKLADRLSAREFRLDKHGAIWMDGDRDLW